MPYRNFDPEVEKLATEWAASACTEAEWEDLGPFGATESKPFRVARRSDGTVGLAKPGRKSNDSTARAAHEKIASDLAYHLGLPVPPVILWDRCRDDVSVRHVSISAWAFSPALTWPEVQAALTPDQRLQVARCASAMMAFESWISADDRKADHLLLNAVEPDGHVQLAFIDYAYSMSKSWQGSEAAKGHASSFLPLDRNEEALHEVADRIVGFDKALIEHIVSRVPGHYVSEKQRDVVLSNLVSRSRRLMSILGVETQEHAA